VEIVRLVAAGKVAKEIALQLNLSTHTVYTHRKNITRKLGLNTTSELVRYAIDRGWVE
jgi:DNA-binding CsgD family transcriptional regulator